MNTLNRDTDVSGNASSEPTPSAERTIEEALAIVIESVAEIAPDVAPELESLDRDTDLFDALELDSMDHVNVMNAIWEHTGVEIPERDYGDLRNLTALARRLSLN